MKIIDILNQDKITLSFEVFPPKLTKNYDDVALDAIVTQNISETVSTRLSDSLEDTNKSRIFNKDETGTSIDFVDPRSIDPDATKKSRKVLKSDTDTADILRKTRVRRSACSARCGKRQDTLRHPGGSGGS